MDLLLQVGQMPSTHKVFISPLRLILHPRRDEQEAADNGFKPTTAQMRVRVKARSLSFTNRYFFTHARILTTYHDLHVCV